MNISKILAGSISGTLVMTLFSYIVSEKKNVQFREPELLNLLLGKVRAGDLRGISNAEGWLIHYTAGLLLTMCYDKVWEKTNAKPTLFNGLILGGVNGIIAITIWRIAFKLKSDPPLTDYQKYYKHLLWAHLFFGAFTVLGYRIPELSGTKNRS